MDADTDTDMNSGPDSGHEELGSIKWERPSRPKMVEMELRIRPRKERLYKMNLGSKSSAYPVGKPI